MKLIYAANVRLPTEKANGIQIMKMCEAFASLRIDTDTGRIFADTKRQTSTGGKKDSRRSGLLYEDLTYKIRGAVFNVYNTLGFGHKESAYQKALEHELEKSGLMIRSQPSVNLLYDGKNVGTYRPDIVVENKMVLELKSSRALVKNDREQVLQYLKGTNYNLALVINFGASKLQIERVINTPNYPRKSEPNISGNQLTNPRKSEPIEVELIVPRRFNPIKIDPFEYYGLERNFKITRIPTLDLVRAADLGPIFFLQTFTFGLASIIFLLLKRSEANVIYTRGEMVLFLKPLMKKFPVFVESHIKPENMTAYLKAFNKSAGVITVTSAYRRELIENYALEEKRVLVAADGVDLESFNLGITQEEARKKLGLPRDEKLIVYTGSDLAWKGLDTLKEASRYLPIDCAIYFVGPVKSVPSQGGCRMEFFGHRPPAEIPYWLAAADVLVLTGTNRFATSQLYTSPLKLFEYLAAGRPIVASRVESFLDVLNDKNSVLVEPDNPQKLAEGIVKVIKNKAPSKKIAQTASREAQRYSWENRASLILDFITKNSPHV